MVSDVFPIQCWNGDRVPVAFSLDRCDREAIRYVAFTRGVDGALVRDLMVERVEARFGSIARLTTPVPWLSGNGPCFVVGDTVTFGRRLGMDICTTPVYSPESNGMAQAIVKTFK